MEMIFFILLFLPAVIPVVATKFLDEGLQNSQLIDWEKIYAALILLFLACICFIVEIAMGLLLGVFFVFLITCIVAFLCGLYLSYFLPRWRKLNGLLVGLVFPVILFISSTTIGLYFDPDSIIKRNGDTIAGALNKYHSDQGRYPEKLDDLVPTYLAELKEPGTMWGWLYIADKDTFTLGYVFYIDKMGYTICKYSAAIPEWDCPMDNSTEPFYLEPTPFPDPLTP
jgi:hypothetical protein